MRPTTDSPVTNAPDRCGQLLQAMARGDEEALAAFYDLTRRRVFGLSARILGDLAAAEEVTLDVYLQVWRRAHDYCSERGSPLAWLMTITRSRAIDRRRQLKFELSLDEPEQSLQEPVDPTQEGEDWLMAADRCVQVREALGQLSHEQRQVLELAYFGGLSHSAIAERLKLPLGTVKTRIRGGMARLHALLAPWFSESVA